MAVIVQDDTGLVVDANSYISVAELEDYATLRGIDLTSYTTEQKESAVINATDYIDTRFDFVGEKTGGDDQITEMPRTIEQDSNFKYWDSVYKVNLGIERNVKLGACQYAYDYLSGGFSLYAVFNKSATTVKREKSKVGPIEEEKEYSNLSSTSSSFPIYQKADNYLKRSNSADSEIFNTWKIG